MRRTDGGSTDADCTIRPFEPGDTERFRSLYESVWGTNKGPAWFEWRFRSNPYADGVEMIVAERDGELIGAEPLVPYRLRAGSRTIDAAQPVDWIVHPDHRREGVFSAMTERLLEYAAVDASVLFNFPNEQLRPGIERFGWTMIDTVASRYRVQNVDAAVDGEATGSARVGAAALRGAGAPLVRAGLGALDRVGSITEGVTVDRVDGVSVAPVLEVYRRTAPERIHVPRERAYLEWRFANPRWETTTYVARRGGDPVATAIVAVESIDDTRLARMLDVQPMTDAAGDADAFDAILATVVADHADADVVKLPTGQYPSVCRRHGFFRGDASPVCRFSTKAFHAVRILDDEIDLPGLVGEAPSAPGSDSSAAQHASTGGTVADGSGFVPPSDARHGSHVAGSASPGVDDADGTRPIDLTEPSDWVLGLGDRDVA